MECFNTNVQTDIRFFQNIVWRKIQLFASNVVSILPSSATFNHTDERSLGGERVNCSTKNSCFCFLSFRDNLWHKRRFRGILPFTLMLRLRKDDHKLSLHCTKSGIQLLIFELPITPQSNTVYSSELYALNTRWIIWTEVGEREDFLVSPEEPKLCANNSKDTCTETRRPRQHAATDSSPPTLEKALPLQTPGANLYFFLPNWVFGYLKSTILLSILTGLGQHEIYMLEGKSAPFCELGRRASTRSERRRAMLWACALRIQSSLLGLLNPGFFNELSQTREQILPPWFASFRTNGRFGADHSKKFQLCPLTQLNLLDLSQSPWSCAEVDSSFQKRTQLKPMPGMLCC